MQSFEYAAPKSIDEALKLLAPAWGDTEVLAGGTDLLSLMKDFIVRPKRLVNLANVGLAGIAPEGDWLVIGAMTTLDALLAHASVPTALTQAAAGVHSPQLRSMGTIGGDLLQRPRCWYFRRGHGLLAQHDGASMVEAGDHRDHAVFGNGGAAKYVNPSSFAPALIALGASVKVRGPNGERSLAVKDLYRTPANETEREFTLAANEILTHVVVPTSRAMSATYEVRSRHGLDWPEATASVAITLADGKVTAATACLGHVAPTPWSVDVAGLVGTALTAETAAPAAAKVVADATPLKNNGHKVELAKVALTRALLRAAGKEVVR